MSAEGGAAARVAGLFPLSEAGAPGRVVEAAESVALVVRFLNHATLGAHAELRGVGDLYAVVGSLAQAVGRWEQLCAQLAVRAEDLAADPTLYSTVADAAGSDQAWYAGTVLRTAGQQSVTVAGLLDVAHQVVSTLGHRDDDGDDDGAGERR